MLQMNEVTLNIAPKKIFLIDCIGAITSTFFLGVVLTTFEEFFGMPSHILYYLASIALVFAVYSFACYFRFPEKWTSFLKVIAFANLFYCILTLILVIYLFQQLTLFGLAYFIGEMILIIGIVSLEFKVAKHQ